jgi:hypothetical protein
MNGKERLRLVLAGCAALCAASVASADITAHVDGSRASNAISERTVTQTVDVSVGRIDPLSQFVPGVTTTLLPVPVADGKRNTVQRLPGAPSSLQLVLTAFGTLGAWQLTRSARKVHLSNLPAWYHAEGAVQVGHTTPLDLDFTLLPICCPETATVSGGGPHAPPWFLNELRPRLESQHFLSIAGPRGPPLRSS